MSESKPKRVHKPAEQRCVEILAAATTVFAEHGYHSADMQAVADAASVGKGTVYRYFPSKEQLFSAALDDALERLRLSILAGMHSQDDPKDQLREVMRAYLGFFDDNPELIELLSQERIAFPERRVSTYFARAPEGREEIAGPLFKRLAQAYPLRDIPLEELMDVGGDLIHGAVFLQCAPQRTRSLRERADTLFDIFIHGIMKP